MPALAPVQKAVVIADISVVALTRMSSNDIGVAFVS